MYDRYTIIIIIIYENCTVRLASVGLAQSLLMQIRKRALQVHTHSVLKIISSWGEQPPYSSWKKTHFDSSCTDLNHILVMCGQVELWSQAWGHQYHILCTTVWDVIPSMYTHAHNAWFPGCTHTRTHMHKMHDSQDAHTCTHMHTMHSLSHTHTHTSLEPRLSVPDFVLNASMIEIRNRIISNFYMYTGLLQQTFIHWGVKVGTKWRKYQQTCVLM